MHLVVDIVKVDPSLVRKISKRHFLRDIEKSFQEDTPMGPEPQHFSSFWNILTNMVARGIQNFGQNGPWLAGWLSNGQNFLSNLRKHVINKCWKCQADIFIHFWFRAKWLKIFVSKVVIGMILETICFKATKNSLASQSVATALRNHFDCKGNFVLMPSLILNFF